MSIKPDHHSTSYRDAGRVAEEAYHYRRASSLHGDLAQLLAAIRMHLISLNNEPSGDSELAGRIDMLDELIGQAFALLRQIDLELYPLGREDSYLFHSLRSLARSSSERYGISCRLIADGDHPELGEEFSLAIFRIAQNTIEHIAHYTESPEILIKLRWDDGSLKLNFYAYSKTSTQAANEVRALMSIREQVKRLRGKLRLSRGGGHGKRFEISVPLDLRYLQ